MSTEFKIENLFSASFRIYESWSFAKNGNKQRANASLGLTVKTSYGWEVKISKEKYICIILWQISILDCL